MNETPNMEFAGLPAKQSRPRIGHIGSNASLQKILIYPLRSGSPSQETLNLFHESDGMRVAYVRQVESRCHQLNRGHLQLIAAKTSSKFGACGTGQGQLEQS
jgi:hypothetical protein